MQMNAKVQQILQEMKSGLLSLYGERLKSIYLFGSYARDEADEESDIDVLIVLDRIEKYAHEVDTCSELVSGLSLKHELSISCVYTSDRKWREDQTLFFLNVREEAIPA